MASGLVNWELRSELLLLAVREPSRPYSRGSYPAAYSSRQGGSCMVSEDGGRATLAARLNSCSQPSAELFVLLLETSQSLHTTFFNAKISLWHDTTSNDT